MCMSSKRHRADVSYRDPSSSELDLAEIESLDDLKSTSYWTEDYTIALRIEVVDESLEHFLISTQDDIDNYPCFSRLKFPEWNDDAWLLSYRNDVKDNDKKTLIRKIKNIYDAQKSSQEMREMHVDGFMMTMLNLLHFDYDPCYLYPQYEYSIKLGRHLHKIVSVADFGVVTENHKILLIVEDKTMMNALYSNNWKEDQVLGELFVAGHNIVENIKNGQLIYPIEVFAIRVVGTLFTFYKSVMTKEYIKESSKKLPTVNSMKVIRHPCVDDDPSKLTAYDICVLDDRIKILRILCGIQLRLKGG